MRMHALWPFMALSLAVAELPAQLQLLEAAKFTASAGSSEEVFGDAVAIAGNTMAIGAPHSDLGGTDRGAVLVCEQPASGWNSGNEVAALTASDGRVGDLLGSAVAISGEIIVAGSAFAHIDGKSNQGAAYVFVKPAAGWSNATEVAKLTASDGQAYHLFGADVAIHGDTILVGLNLAVSGKASVYLFEKPVTGWTSMHETAVLDITDAVVNGSFGASLAIEGDTIAIGAVGQGGKKGKIYVFEKPATGWTSMTQTAGLVASDGARWDYLGRSVAIRGTTIVAGADGVALGGNQNQGAVYLFERPASGWAFGTETCKLTASDGGALEGLGHAVAIEGDVVLASADYAAITSGGGTSFSQGAVYAFVKPETGWVDATENGKLVATDGAAGDLFGYSLGMSGSAAVIGAQRADVAGVEDAGAAYVFERPLAFPLSGCGSSDVGVSGSKRIGTTMTLTSPSCAPGSVHLFFVGSPLPAPFAFPTALSCTGASPCVLSCNPLITLPGPTFAIEWVNEPSYIGLSLCVQGACVEPAPCLSITDMVIVTLSN